MAVYITGDCHGDWYKLIYNSPTKNGDYVIVCGDFGIWHNLSGGESRFLDSLEKLNYTILWCDGNHENFDRLYGGEFEEVDYLGGRAHKIRNNVFHLMRGYIFNIEGKKFFVFGGASSHDIRDGIIALEDYSSEDEFYEAIYKARKLGKMFRIKGMSWWERELPTDEEMENGRVNLKLNNNDVDFVISHCLPQTVASVLSHGNYKADKLTSYFDEIAENNKFTKWYCGHYHTERVIMGKFILTYDSFERAV